MNGFVIAECVIIASKTTGLVLLDDGNKPRLVQECEFNYYERYWDKHKLPKIILRGYPVEKGEVKGAEYTLVTWAPAYFVLVNLHEVVKGLLGSEYFSREYLIRLLPMTPENLAQLKQGSIDGKRVAVMTELPPDNYLDLMQSWNSTLHMASAKLTAMSMSRMQMIQTAKDKLELTSLGKLLFNSVNRNAPFVTDMYGGIQLETVMLKYHGYTPFLWLPAEAVEFLMWGITEYLSAYSALFAEVTRHNPSLTFIMPSKTVDWNVLKVIKVIDKYNAYFKEYAGTMNVGVFWDNLILDDSNRVHTLIRKLGNWGREYYAKQYRNQLYGSKKLFSPAALLIRQYSIKNQVLNIEMAGCGHRCGSCPHRKSCQEQNLKDSWSTNNLVSVIDMLRLSGDEGVTEINITGCEPLLQYNTLLEFLTHMYYILQIKHITIHTNYKLEIIADKRKELESKAHTTLKSERE